MQLSQSVGTPSAATASRRASTIAIGSAPRAHSSLTINPSRTYTSRREREREAGRERTARFRERGIIALWFVCFGAMRDGEVGLGRGRSGLSGAYALRRSVQGSPE